MFHIFFLIVSLAGQPTVAMSNETYPTKEACVAAMPARVEQGNNILKAGGAQVVASVCATEEEFKQKALPEA